jgi:antitoxin (DNA-binding transcriptional repressor) of toxin-antitoxin stability system
VIKELVKDDDIVLTANGKPLAFIVGIPEGGLDRTAAALRRARAQLAVSAMRRTAEEAGSDTLSANEIDTEIRATRAARRQR